MDSVSLRPTKSYQYNETHGASTLNMITIDAHMYNSIVCECKEMKTQLHQLQRVIMQVGISID